MGFGESHGNQAWPGLDGLHIETLKEFYHGYGWWVRWVRGIIMNPICRICVESDESAWWWLEPTGILNDFPRKYWEWNVIIPTDELTFVREIETTNQRIIPEYWTMLSKFGWFFRISSWFFSWISRTCYLISGSWILFSARSIHYGRNKVGWWETMISYQSQF